MAQAETSRRWHTPSSVARGVEEIDFSSGERRGAGSISVAPEIHRWSPPAVVTAHPALVIVFLVDLVLRAPVHAASMADGDTRRSATELASAGGGARRDRGAWKNQHKAAKTSGCGPGAVYASSGESKVQRSSTSGWRRRELGWAYSVARECRLSLLLTRRRRSFLVLLPSGYSM